MFSLLYSVGRHCRHNDAPQGSVIGSRRGYEQCWHCRSLTTARASSCALISACGCCSIGVPSLLIEAGGRALVCGPSHVDVPLDPPLDGLNVGVVADPCMIYQRSKAETELVGRYSRYTACSCNELTLAESEGKWLGCDGVGCVRFVNTERLPSRCTGDGNGGNRQT